MKKLIYISMALFLLVACNGKSQSNAQSKTNTDLVMELPKLTSQASEQIIEHTAMTISYNLQWNIPNWVAYTLTSAETTGEYGRKNKFYPDPNIKHNPVVTQDYSHSGYDRGHMAPAADMKWSEQAMLESFYTTNICPQNPNLNRGDWNDLEEMARDWANKYDSIHIACGPIFGDCFDAIGTERRIVVPQFFFKVFLRQNLTASGHLSAS